MRRRAAPIARGPPLRLCIEDHEADTTHMLDLDDLDPDTPYGYLPHARDEERKRGGHGTPG